MDSPKIEFQERATEKLYKKHKDLLRKIIHSPDKEESEFLLNTSHEYSMKLLLKSIQESHKKIKDKENSNIFEPPATNYEFERVYSNDSLRYWDDGDNSQIVNIINLQKSDGAIYDAFMKDISLICSYIIRKG